MPMFHLIVILSGKLRRLVGFDLQLQGVYIFFLRAGLTRHRIGIFQYPDFLHYSVDTCTLLTLINGSESDDAVYNKV